MIFGLPLSVVVAGLAMFVLAGYGGYTVFRWPISWKFPVFLAAAVLVCAIWGVQAMFALNKNVVHSILVVLGVVCVSYIVGATIGAWIAPPSSTRFIKNRGGARW